MLLASTSSCSIAAGRRTSVDTSRGRCPSRRTNRASLPAVVVLPDPCSPASTTTVGGAAVYVIGTRSPLRDLAVGPIGPPGQVQDAPLVRGQQRAVEVEQAQVPLPSAGSVKHLALTVYGRYRPAWRSSLFSTNCSSQRKPITAAASTVNPIAATSTVTTIVSSARPPRHRSAHPGGSPSPGPPAPGEPTGRRPRSRRRFPARRWQAPRVEGKPEFPTPLAPLSRCRPPTGRWP